MNSRSAPHLLEPEFIEALRRHHVPVPLMAHLVANKPSDASTPHERRVCCNEHVVLSERVKAKKGLPLTRGRETFNEV